MKKNPAIIFLLLITNVCFAQLSDDFSDGDFTANPTWSSTISKFTVNSSKQLRLYDSIAVTGFTYASYLSTPFSTTTLNHFEWRFYVKQSFAPSANNYGRVYLTSDVADLTQPLHGYYLQFGEAGSNDAIELFRQDGTTTPISVCRGTNGRITTSFTVGVKVTDSAGVWKLYVDSSGGTNYKLEATGTDNTYNSSSFFGVVCVYTKTNATKIYYDDFYIASTGPQPDTTPPLVDSIKVISSNSLSVFFSETIDKISAENSTNYSVDNLIGNPSSAILQSDKKTVILSFVKNFQSGIENQLNISNVKDTTGNVMLSAIFPFTYFEAISDTTPPLVDSVKVISSNSLSVFFSEKINKTSAESITNYSANNLIGDPSFAILQSDLKTVLLSFSKKFESGIENQLNVSNVKDTANNMMLSSTFPFTYFEVVSDTIPPLIDSVRFVQDDFSDGDFTTNPTWSSTISKFIISSSKQLRLYDSIAATEVTYASYLSTQFSTTTLDNYEWRFYVKQSFSPSGSNYGKVYLTSDVADLTQPLHGYYLQFGETGSNDAIELFKQNGTTSTSICRGTNAKIATSFSVNVNVTDSAGVWKLYADYSGGTDYILEASGMDNTYNSSSFFGVVCIYTKTNATKFYYDDFFAGLPITPAVNDTIPPSVDSVKIVSSNSLSIFFSERIDKVSSEDITNYSVNNSIGNPTSAILQSDLKTVLLFFSKKFESGIENQLSISNVKDTTGNMMLSVVFPLLYFENIPAKNKDIIFTEIFADPSPQVGLPVQEYLEIYNRSSTAFNLSGWKLSDGSSTATFKNQIILPNQYWIVCASSNANLFSTYGNVIGVSNFPTLNNDGDKLTLRDATNQLIDSVNYTLDWYYDADKQEGGWSIEIIDTNNTCAEEENWVASEDERGGTPGKQNSVFANKPDLTGPQLISVTPQSSTLLYLTFNEKLEKDLLGVSILISPSVSISKKYFTDQSLRQIAVQLSDTLKFRELYNITVNNLTDCGGNFIQEDFSQLTFALPEAANSLDVLVNEILFNPRPSGVDFVEVYNNSPKYINLKNWKLGNVEDDSIKNLKTITANDFILAPLGYLVFTSDPSMLSLQYPQSIQTNFFKTTLPSLPDDEGSIVLVNNQNLKIDKFVYSSKMHSPLIKDEEGVSLERISFSLLTNDVSNWKSANASANFATPGFVNSNSRPESLVNENAIVIDPQIFSPAIVGKDFSKINYKFEQSGMAATVKILDAQGRLIKTLANNEILAYEGFFRWDGDRDDGSRARVGYYVVWFEVFDTSGFNKVFRKRTVIGK